MVRIPHLVVLLFVLALTAPAGAAAEPPANDVRTSPQQLGGLPANVRGTTVDATTDADEPFSGCSAQIKNSVWYAFTAGADRGVLAALDAAGDMDAVIEVFERQRSQISTVSCQTTNRRGEATVDFDAAAGTDYLIRVAPLSNSVADAFSLRVVVPDEPARPPGQQLAGNGVNAFVDRFANPDDAWSVRLREGRTYRINFVTTSSGCAQLSLFPAGTGSFAVSPLRTMRCDSHTVYTPPESGRYTLLVRAPRASRARLNYRLRVGQALDDDTAPGLTLANDDRRSGSIQGSEIDALDLYRFTIERPSDLRIRLRTGADIDVLLIDDEGRRRGCGCGGSGDKQIQRRVRPGRYFVAVRAANGADGSYTLSRLARTITRSDTLADTGSGRTVAPGAMVRLRLRVTPAVEGRATMLVERFDPLAGWLFDARFRPAVNAGMAVVAFRPPSVGRWRVTAGFDGTRIASPSAGGTASFRVEEPDAGS
jgi:hypothetical protein